MPDKRPGRLPLFSLPLSLGWTAAFCANMGGGLRLCLGMAWPRGGGGGVWRPFRPPNQRAQGPKAPAPFVCASRTRRPPPRGQANAALPVVGRIGFTKQNSEPHSVWLAEGEQGA